ncbi:gene transfer agent family protein [Rhizobium rhizogenes]|uniref:Gene transfer agent family protein n=1 Tax=Rhizobium rhizogenes TaxID=359 RepID=A0AA88EYQ2_RHIRH|nr:gene transfer agent family protein [Rhizobium rhizogenes]KAA3500821.1 gene transfer agent family protein [Rhizobium rhizogenes]
MTERTPVKQFFGDAEYEFHLPPDLVLELERKTGSGVGLIFRRFLTSEFGFSDLTEVLRLGLVGAGMKPADAAVLVTTYAARMAVTDLYLVALPIMDALMTGNTVQPVAKTRRTRNRK